MTAVAFRFERTGLVLLPAASADSGSQARVFVVLPDGETFLIDAAGSLEPVPGTAQKAIRALHEGQRVAFPRVLPGEPLVLSRPPGAPVLRWVDPMKIELVYGGTDGPSMARQGGAVMDGDWDVPHGHRFDDLDVYRAIEERFSHGRPWRDTEFYTRITRAIQRGNFKWDCEDIRAFERRLESLDELFDAMKRHGYRTQAELGSDRVADEVRLGIDRNGRFLFIDGRHRLAMARVLNFPKIPVNVVVRHKAWVDFKQEIDEYIATRKGRVYQTVDHPDLADLAAHHGRERVDMLRELLAGYPAEGKRLLDVGAHWGAMTQQMSELGFKCTAVEANKRCARIAERISAATDAGFTVWQGEIFDFPDAEEQDVVLALNIFHHLIKTEELHAGLVEFLHRLNVELIVFEPHVADASSQMEGAFRNYGEEEFAYFVAAHAGLRDVEQVGRAPDGRALFRLSGRDPGVRTPP